MIRTSIALIIAIAAQPIYAVNCNQSFNSSFCNSRPIIKEHAREVVREVVEVERRNITNNFFYSVGDSVRYPIVAPQAVIQAEYGQLERQLQRVQDQMSDLKTYSASYSQPQQQPQLICVPAVQAYTMPQQQCQTQQYTQQQQTYQQQQTQNQTSRDLRGTRTSVLDAKCLKCHGGSGAPKGKLDLRGEITCEQFKHAVDRLMTDDNDLRMPKGQPPLSGTETAQAFKELLSIAVKDRPPAPAQLPATQRPAATQQAAPMPPPAAPEAAPAAPEQPQPQSPQ